MKKQKPRKITKEQIKQSERISLLLAQIGLMTSKIQGIQKENVMLLKDLSNTKEELFVLKQKIIGVVKGNVRGRVK